MNFRQTYRMVFYRWKLFIIIFIVALIGAYSIFSFVSRLSYSRAALQEAQLEVWGSSTVFMVETMEHSGSNLVNEPPSIMAGLSKMAELYCESKAFVDSMQFDMDEDGFPVIWIVPLERCLWISVNGTNMEAVQSVNEALSRDISRMIPSGMKTYLLFQDSIPRLVDEGILDNNPGVKTPNVVQTDSFGVVTLSMAKALALSLITAVLCALVGVFARENLDKTIRSVYHLKKAIDITALPTLSPGYTESELLSLMDALPKNKPIILSGVSKNCSPSLSVSIAETIAHEGFSIAIVDFCGGIVSENPHVSIIPVQEKTVANCLSDKFISELCALKDRHSLVLIAAPAVNDSGIAVALSGDIPVVVVLRWGRDTDERVQSAVSYFGQNNIIGATIADYRPNSDYIWEG